MAFRPFEDGDARGTFRNLIDRIEAEITSLEPEYVLKASRSELEEYYKEQLYIEPLLFYPDRWHIADPKQVDIDVTHDPNRCIPRGEQAIIPGTYLQVVIPFEGDPHLWRLGPSTQYVCLHYPPIEVKDNNVILSVSFANDTANATIIKNNINVTVKQLSDTIDLLNKDIGDHNNRVPAWVKRAIEQKIEQAKSVTGVIEGLGIPIRKRDEPLTYALPVKRRAHPVKRPEVSTEPYRLEPTLAESEYAHILNVMRSMSLVIERSPHVFTSLDEEDIRTHFLLQLNGHYEGGATGETFNAAGRTDILIRVDGRNCFIGECKFWRGQEAFNEAIDQLLDYLSWRDVKCALVVFNKTRNSSAVRRKMHEVMQGRREHRKTVSHDAEGDSRYIYVKGSDPGKEIIITTQLYDMPCRK
ncbi:MAG: hypothetical protein A2Y76_14930 [Planctomycetes bacterium RBG_13_60_9]|nr:MAG: hypothetical protein A2Y76_14930 [Planctomycetes bacterium RBG_13_60_9]